MKAEVINPHPNRIPFRGVLAYVDRPSESSPSGARGRLVIITNRAAKDALPSLIGMAVNFAPDWTNHDMRRVAGVITDAELEGDLIIVRGHIFAINFPDLAKKLRDDAEVLGMSYELHDAHVVDMRRSTWTIERLTFTGAAIQLREKCAYRETSIVIDERIVPTIAALAAQ